MWRTQWLRERVWRKQMGSLSPGRTLERIRHEELPETNVKLALPKA